MRSLRTPVAAVLLGIMLAAPAHAAPGTWDHAANIKDAAQRLAKLHKREGSTGVLKFLDACYRTHMLASDFSKGLESCMAQDYMHTQVLATIYSKLPPERLQRLGAPSPQRIADAMSTRFVAAFTQYKVSVADGEDFKKLVDTHGFPVFIKAVFPKGTPAEADAGKPDAGKTGGAKSGSEK